MRVTHIGEVGELATNGRWQSWFRHTRAVCRKLMAVELGMQKRQVIQMPPRHGKTRTCANVLPFHYFTLFPNREIIYVAHSGDFASEQGEQLRNMITESGSLFGIGVSQASAKKDDFDIVDLDGRPTGGSFRAFGINAGIHGRGCHLLLLDDLFKNVEQALSATVREAVWRTYTSSLHTRLTPDGAVVSMGTPLHDDDWFGRAAKAEVDGADSWDWMKLHAFAREDDACGREVDEPLWPDGGWTEQALDDKRTNLTISGNYRDWVAQYELEPISGDGVTEWPKQYFEHVQDVWQLKDVWTSVLSVDTSKGARAQKKGDWQALVYAEADVDGHVEVDSDMQRLDSIRLRDRVLTAIERWHPRAVVIETNSAGYALLEELWERGIPALGRYHNSNENKVIRLTQRIGRALEAGILHFRKTPHNRIVLDQARLFPHSKYDDGIDALEMGLEFISQLKLPKHLRRVHYQTRIAA